MSTSPTPTLKDRQRGTAPGATPARGGRWYRNPRYAVALVVVLAVVAAVLVLTSPEDRPGGARSDDQAAASTAAYDDAYGTFEPVEASGTGDDRVALPAGATVGIVTARADGPGLFDVGFVRGRSAMGLISMSGATTPYAGSVPFGFDGMPTTSWLQVWAEGPWRLTVTPVSAAEELPEDANGTGDAVFRYDGEATEWDVELHGTGGFVIRQWRLDRPEGLQLALGSGAFDGTVLSLAGPSVVAIHTDGPWSITAK